MDNYKLLLKAMDLNVDKFIEGLSTRRKKTLRKNTKLSKFQMLRYKIFFFIRVLIIPIIHISFFKKEKKSLIYGYSEYGVKIWDFFISHYYGEPTRNIRREKIYCRDIGNFPLKLWLNFIVFAIKWNPHYKSNWIIFLFDSVFIFLSNRRHYKNIYVFYMNHPTSYIFSAYLESNSFDNVKLHMGNNPILKWNFPLPFKFPLICSSAIQLDEVRFAGLSNSVDFFPDEFIKLSHHVKPKLPTVDIGFISSAEWAREDGLYRSNDMEKIASHALAKNSVYEKFSEGLNKAATFGKRENLRIMVYPHPFERELISKGIYPPYYELVKSGEVEIDLGGESSRDKIYEAKVAISYHSSFIWERITRGLEKSYHFYFDNDQLDLVDATALDKYKNNLFYSNNDLEMLLEEAKDEDSRTK